MLNDLAQIEPVQHLNFSGFTYCRAIRTYYLLLR